jgi:hypothetical protein
MSNKYLSDATAPSGRPINKKIIGLGSGVWGDVPGRKADEVSTGPLGFAREGERC